MKIRCGNLPVRGWLLPIAVTAMALPGAVLAATPAAELVTLRAELQRVTALAEREHDAREIQNLMSRRAHLQVLGRNDLWIDLFARKQADVSWYMNGRYRVGLDELKAAFVGDGTRAQRSLESIIKLYPDIENKPENYGVGEFRQHALSSPLIEVAGDGKTAKGFWHSSGPQLAIANGQPSGSLGVEKYAVDFIKEDGQWRFWHMATYTETYLQLGKTLAEQVPAPGSPRPPPREGQPVNPYPEWSPWRVPAQVPLPVPYRTFSETFSYGPPARTSTTTAAPPQLFDGHLHLIADDTVQYPRVTAVAPPAAVSRAPAAAPPPGGLPPGTGGQPGGLAGPSVSRADTDAVRVMQWMTQTSVSAAAAVQKRGTYGVDNRYTLDSSDKYPDRLVPVVVLDAEDPNTPKLVGELARARGLAGVRLTGNISSDGRFPWLSSPQALKTWEVFNDAGLVADLMVSDIRRPAEGIAELIRLADAYPRVRLVLDHAGYPPRRGAPDFGIDELHASLARHKNIYFKFTAINLDLLREARLQGSEADFVRRLVDVYGADHVLWGSDAGNSSGSYAEIVARMVAATAKLNDAERRAVLHDNGRRVYARGGGAQRATEVVKAPPTALALEAVYAALERCRANGYPEVSAAVVGASGELRVLLAEDAAPAGHAVPNSERKARTAATFASPTSAVLARTKADAAFAAQVNADEKLLARAGGQPLYSRGKLIGAIGVSGAPGGDKDEVCALAGVERIRARL